MRDSFARKFIERRRAKRKKRSGSKSEGGSSEPLIQTKLTPEEKEKLRAAMAKVSSGRYGRKRNDE